MPFPFTFIFNVPGIINPFAANSKHFVSAPTPSNARLGQDAQQSPPAFIPRSQLPKINRPRPPPSTLEPLSRSPTPVSRKRGWHPAFTEPSASTTTLASTSGYLYPPARSRDHFMSSTSQNPHVTSNESDQHDPHEGEEMPPLKKRRGLAGTIISTAVTAALIGSAVGLTVYRLWRNRGKLQQEQHQIEATPEPSSEALTPPPPYDAPFHHQQHSERVHLVPSSPPSSAKKTRHPRQNKHTAAQHRRRKSQRNRTHPEHHHSVSSSSHPYFQTQPEFDFEREPQEDKMDWIGDKLSMLIEQGKRALNTHVVVSSDAIEDEVDDGGDGWEEENDMNRHTRSRSGSVRHSKRPKTLNLGPGQSTHHVHTSSSPHFADFNFPMSSSAPNTSFLSGYSTLPASQSTTSLNNISIEDPSTFESRELRESMERARQRLMARRLGGT